MKGKGIIFLDILICLIITIVVSGIMLNILFPFKYKRYIVEYADISGVDKVLVASIIYAESKYNPNAKSPQGACGLMQLLPSTAKAFYDREGEFDENMLFEPKLNIEIGIKYLKYLFDKYQDEVTVLACYNAGESNVLEWMGESESLEKTQIKYKETLNYVNKIQNVKKYYRHKF